MIKFKADAYTKKIIKVECEKETDSSVWINGRRNAKISSWDNYFTTFDEAAQWKISQANKEIDQAKNTLNYRQQQLDDFLKYVEEQKC